VHPTAHLLSAAAPTHFQKKAYNSLFAEILDLPAVLSPKLLKTPKFEI